ncbi:SNARE associated Golgi family protein [Babesia bovis T2Bo]|uniref:VTT domain-containing protein n=1 Tax=Babesia bovis TaxID=5865 RepID=A7AVT6_BABBO|nr:SNARE associated Golgi family protein [Babesia bovis T2Bo]EDO05912.1 SNARE associated Golgi family protein [Babesia bovis T2Bo]|eukprot:XP_001609480.1 hypothetical protein [Babesia bovis T2Bo]
MVSTTDSRWPPSSANGTDHTTTMNSADDYGRETMDDDGTRSAREPLLLPETPEPTSSRFLERFLILLWITATALFIIYRKNVTDFVRYVASKGADHKLLLYVCYVLIFIVMVTLCVSAELMIISAGFIFSHVHGQKAGILIGTTISFVAYFFTMLLCFFISRYLLKRIIHKYLRFYRYYGALIRATENEGFHIAGLIRMSPFFPPTLVSYIFGSTNIPTFDYAMATFGAIPSIAFFTYLGALIEDFTDDAKPTRSTFEITAFIVISMTITIGGLYYTYHITKKYLEPNRSPRGRGDAESNAA